jgi:hypothetical protein
VIIVVYSYEIVDAKSRGFIKVVMADSITINTYNTNVINFILDGRIVGFAPTDAIITEDQDM